MVPNHDASLIILTYKKKLLLILRDNKPEIASPNCWAFLGGIKEDNESFEEACKREVEEEICIKLDSVYYISTLIYENKRKYFYYAELNEDEVECINLTEGQKYDFFSVEEVKKLSLARSVEIFFEKNESLIGKLVS